jgi:hypothetical protein
VGSDVFREGQRVARGVAPGSKDQADTLAQAVVAEFSKILEP